MANELSISQTKPITQYRKGASFAIKTTTGDYAIDYETAQKLSELVVANNELRFVKVDTEQGQVVINTASIMAIAVDDTDARSNVARIRNILTERPDWTKEDIFAELNSSNRYYGKRRISQEVFDYLYDVARGVN